MAAQPTPHPLHPTHPPPNPPLTPYTPPTPPPHPSLTPPSQLEPLWLPEETLTEDQLRNWYDEDKEELKRWRREKRKAERKQG